ncbi:MAG: threonylcarbamoyl-AMP synthase [candidate division Zixibacteria bacterium]|nr:threonylcarbamoyl-AMP synthase [candidate division Zixibacteria bacterium]
MNDKQKAPIIRIHPENPENALLEGAADLIRSGGLVAFPTETVYGLGADASDSEAVRRIYAAKGRPEHNPVLVLIADRSWLTSLVADIPACATPLMEAFWPGPLTLAFPAAPGVDSELLGGGTTIGVRYPGASVALRLTNTVGRPITAPSANRSGGPPPLTAQAVADDLEDRIDLILDGGPAGEAIPSTVVDVSGTAPRLVRPGRVAFEDILKVWNHATGKTPRP